MCKAGSREQGSGNAADCVFADMDEEEGAAAEADEGGAANDRRADIVAADEVYIRYPTRF